MAMITVHQWRDLDRGLRELRRVARGPVVVLTFEGTELSRFWLTEYIPRGDRRRAPPLSEVDDVGAILGGEATVSEVPIPIDCVDGFCEAYYARPEAFLDPAVRQSQSSWRFVDPVAAERDLGRLREALASGEWEAEHGHLRTQPRYVGAGRLIVAR